MDNILKYLCGILFYLLFDEKCDIFENKTPIIIIGAGSAGISAATRLLENGIDDFLILEAESQIGGRIRSVEFGDGYVDLGAASCHGQKGNIVWEKLVQMNLTNLLRHTKVPNNFFLSSGKNVSEDVSNEVVHAMLEMLHYKRGSRNESMGLTYGKMYNDSITEKFGNDREKLEVAQSALHWLAHIVMCMEGTISWYDSRSKTSYQVCEGHQELIWKGAGYGIFLDILMGKYPDQRVQLPIDEKILLNKEVTKVSWSPTATKKRVEISCLDGSIYIARHVIFTPSLGVLKERAEDLFVPRLPENKMAAIENIGMGATMKVYLQYPSRWWRDEVSFNFVWGEDDKRDAMNVFPGQPSPIGESWITRLYSVEMLKENPRVLLVWITGDIVDVLETIDDDILLSGIEFTMNKFLGHIYDIPKPEKILRSTWYSNPNFRGTYSYQTLNTTDHIITDLMEPLRSSDGSPVIQFAGEATSPQHFSTVHGAIESGYREADRLIEMYTQ
ncbi:unnamed protein product [Phaedon cochleariae]|uniref:Amine oxidase domain-containing protein n=1 Tax=Phaedon cochleariae TaxID=80249 RepID=A0A9P0DTF4_PHACE|nr:unnamed protein product [Phaedon cochleariae]